MLIAKLFLHVTTGGLTNLNGNCQLAKPWISFRLAARKRSGSEIGGFLSMREEHSGSDDLSGTELVDTVGTSETLDAGSQALGWLIMDVYKAGLCGHVRIATGSTRLGREALKPRKGMVG